MYELIPGKSVTQTLRFGWVLHCKFYNMPLYNTFLHHALKDGIYMEQPGGYAG